jgi:hypothetical protein
MLDENQHFYIPPAGTPEAVALTLFHLMARAEGKVFNPRHDNNADRKWILDTYAECLFTVMNPVKRVNKT